MIVFAREKVQALWPELFPLFEAHYHEIAKYQDIELSPNTEAYEAMENAGVLRWYTARSEGRLIGYASFVVQRHLHYSKSLNATQDLVFLDPAYRGGRTGYRLMRYTEEQLKAEGVQVITHHVKVGHPALAGLLEFMGYEVMDLVYTRRVD